MRTSKTIEVSPLGMPIEIDIAIDFSHDPGCWRTPNGDGWPATTDIDGWEYDEAAAVADFWATVDDVGEDVTRAIITQLAEKKLSVREAIAAEVARAVELMELEDDGEDYE